MTPPHVSIRRLTAADIDVVLRHGDVFSHQPSVEWTEDFLARGSNFLLLALDAGEPVASLVAVETANLDTSPDLFVYEIFVRESHRHRGIAHVLLDKIVETADEAGCTRVWASLTSGRDGSASPAPSVAPSHTGGSAVAKDATAIVIPLG